MGSVRIQFLHHPNHFLQLFHQMALVLQSTCGIGNQHIDISGLGSLQGIKQHRGAIGTCMLGNHRNIVALAPNLQLLNRSRAEGITGCQHDRLAFALILFGQLAYGGGLANAVDPHH